MKKKRLAQVIVLVAVITITASAVGAVVSVTLKSSQTVNDQIIALTEYLTKLPTEQQEEWVIWLRGLSEGEETEDPSEIIVFIADTGARYHSDKNCSGLRHANRISTVTKEVAIEMGRTPCQICYGD